LSDGASDASGPDASALASCSEPRDVLYVAVGGKGPAGYFLPFPSNPSVVTSADATWSGSAVSRVGASASAIDGNGGTVFVTGAPAPGTYAQPLSTTAVPYLQLVVGGVDLTADGNSSGSFTIVEADTDDGGTTLQSFLITFDLQVPTNGGLAPITGCMRYTADPTPVPGPTQPLGTGAALLKPCSGDGYGFYADVEDGYPGPAGVTHVDSTDATFSAGKIGSTVELDVQAGMSSWQLQASPNLFGTADLQPGTYTLDGGSGGPTFQVLSPIGGCTFPTGTLGVVDLVQSDYEVSRLATWFDLQCAGQASLRGCAVYGE
jgi:hypothetical protein